MLFETQSKRTIITCLLALSSGKNALEQKLFDISGVLADLDVYKPCGIRTCNMKNFVKSGTSFAYYLAMCS